MPSAVRTLLLLSLIPLSFGCDDAEDSQLERPPGSAGLAAVVGTGGTPATGSGGSAGHALSGAGGSSGSGSGGEASSGGGTSTGTGGASAMAGAGGSSGGMDAGGTRSRATPPGPAGPEDGKTFAGHCYLLVTSAKSFQAAKTDCMSKQ